MGTGASWVVEGKTSGEAEVARRGRKQVGTSNRHSAGGSSQGAGRIAVTMGYTGAKAALPSDFGTTPWVTECVRLVLAS